MKPGDVVADRYRLEALADKGGMGSVFRATDLTTSALCALKVMRADGERSAEITRRFAREVRALTGVRHPAVVRCLDHGFVDATRPWLVMEWVEGETLRRRLGAGAPTLAEALGALHRLLEAIAAVHRAGIVHRDIKPNNLMLPSSSFDEIRIVDFGIARLEDVPAIERTAAGFRMGTPGYMAPEQIFQARNVDGRADVFSLGCVAFEMLSGQRVFPGEDGLQRLARLVVDDAPPLEKVAPNVPAEVADVVARMLVRDTRKRPEARALLEEVAALRDRFAAADEGTRVPTIVELDPDLLTDDEEEEATSAGPSVVTPSPGTLVGRDAELARLVELARPGRLVAVCGACGIGKSRLLRELAAVAESFVLLDASAAHDVDALVRALAVRLDLVRVDVEHKNLVRALRSRGPTILAIDGVDGLGDSLPRLLRAWMRGAPAITVVVAGRDEIGWADDVVTLGPLSPLLATQLLRTRAADASIATSGDEDIARLVRHFDGNPLSIELAATQLRSLGAKALLARLERNSALDLVWAPLATDERRALGRLAEFEGEIMIDDATRVIGHTDARALLEALRERSLCVQGSKENTITLFSAVRDYAREAELDPDRREVHATYVVDLGERLAERVERLGDAEAFERLSMRVDDLLSIADGDDLRAARATLAVHAAIIGRVPAPSHLALLERAIAIVERHADVDGLRARLGRARGRMLALLGRFEEARVDLASALEHARLAGDAFETAASLMEFAVGCHLTGDVEGGERCCHGVLELRHRFESPRLEARAVGNLGGLAHDAGRFDEAYARYVEAIALAESADDAVLLGVFLANLAMLDADRGHPSIARSRLYRALAGLRRTGEERLVAIVTANLGMVEIELDRAAPARAHLERAAATLAEIGDERSESLARMRLAAAAALLGDVEAAAASLALARRLAVADEKTAAAIDVFEAFVHLARGDRVAVDASRERANVRLASGRTLVTSSDDVRAALRVITRAAAEAAPTARRRGAH